MGFRADRQRPPRHVPDHSDSGPATASDRELESYLAAISPDVESGGSTTSGRFGSAEVFQLRLPAPRIEQLRRFAEARGVPPTSLAVDWVVERLDAEQASARRVQPPAPRPPPARPAPATPPEPTPPGPARPRFIPAQPRPQPPRQSSGVYRATPRHAPNIPEPARPPEQRSPFDQLPPRVQPSPRGPLDASRPVTRLNPRVGTASDTPGPRHALAAPVTNLDRYRLR